jgi:biotin transporter BioY
MIAQFLFVQNVGIDAGWLGLPINKIWSCWIAPFILIDLIKSLIAAIIFSTILRKILLQ